MLTLFALIGYGLLIYALAVREDFLIFYMDLIKKENYNTLLELGVFVFMIFLFINFTSGNTSEALGVVLLFIISPFILVGFIKKRS